MLSLSETAYGRLDIFEKQYSPAEEQKAWGPIFLDEDDEFDEKRKKILAKLRKEAIEADNGIQYISLSELNNKEVER